MVGPRYTLVHIGIASQPAVCIRLTAFAGTVGELAENVPSWRRYRQDFLRTMAFGEHETYDHPVACAAPPIDHAS